MKKRIVALILCAVMVLSLAACGGGNTPSTTKAPTTTAAPGTTQATNPEAKVIQIGHPDPSGKYSRFDFAIDKINEKLKENCNGAIQFLSVPNGQLGTETDMLNGVSEGSMDACMISCDTFSSQIPMLHLFSMPYMFNYYGQSFLLLDDPDFMKKTRDEFANNWGIQVMGGYMYNGPRMLCATKPIRTLADAKGMIVRTTTNPIATATWTAIGAQPTVIAFSECYTAFSQGVCEAIDCPVTTQHICNFYEIGKYLNYTDEYDVLSIPLMNKKLYESFSPELQKALDEAFEYGVKAERENEIKNIELAGKEMTDGTVAKLERCDIDRAEFQKVCLPVHESYYNDEKIGGPDYFDWAYEKLDEDNKAKGYPLWKDLATWTNYSKK